MAYPFGAFSAIMLGLLLFLSPAAATGTLWLLAFPYIWYLSRAINAEMEGRVAANHYGKKLGVTILSCLLGTFVAVMMHNADVAERAEQLAGQNAEKEKIGAEQIEEQAEKDKLAWQGDNLAFRCSRKDLTVTTADGSEKLLEIFIQHDASNKRAKVYMTGSVLKSEILDIEESDEQFDYRSSDLYVMDTRTTAQRTDSIAQRTFSYTVSGKRINELKLNRIDGKLKFEDYIDDEYSYLRTIDCQKIESAAFSSQTAALSDEAIEADRRAISKKEAERAELKAKRQF
jgi:hypothetical protein